MSGYIGPIPVPQGIQRKQSFTATAGQTTFNTNGYTDGNFITVYLNGVRLINGTDYTATNGSDVVLTSAAAASDVLDFETFQTFNLVDQTFDNVTLKNPTHEDTDGGRESAVSFKGEQSGGEISTLAAIQASHDGTSDDQKGDLIFKTNDGSDNNAPTERLRIDSDGLSTFTGDVKVGDDLLLNTDSAVLSIGADADLKITHDGTNGDFESAGNLTFDVSGDLIIDVDGGDVKFNDGGTEFSQYYKDGNDLAIYSSISDGDIKFQGVDGGSVITALTLDMSNAGTATFNHDIFLPASGNLYFTSGSGFSPRISNSNSDTAMSFFTNNTERFQIATNGNVMIGTTSDGGVGHTFKNSGQHRLTMSGTGAFQIVQFSNGSGASQVGSIVLSGSSTSYNTSSDYRLKENVTDVTDGITRVKQLSPKRFNFIVDADNTVDGFLAHEAATVVPEAVTGTKDAMTEEVLYVDGDEIPDGKKVGDVKTASTIDPQGIDQSKLVPLLTAALQEAIAKIETLETKVAALEAE